MGNPSSKGVFISFEGGDGSGKSTQIELLANWIGGVWHGKVTRTKEPGGAKETNKIRKLLVAKDSPEWDSVTEALLMAASRKENLIRNIKPALEAGEAVLTDRFYDSTIAYQGAGGASQKLITALHADDIEPNFTILLDIDPELGLERSARPENVDTRFENKGIAFHQKVRKEYLELAKREHERFFKVDASQNEKNIHDQITTWLEPRLKEMQARNG
jgi:dTMP kinase